MVNGTPTVDYLRSDGWCVVIQKGCNFDRIGIELDHKIEYINIKH